MVTLLLDVFFKAINNMFYQNFASYKVVMKALFEQVSTYQHCTHVTVEYF